MKRGSCEANVPADAEVKSPICDYRRCAHALRHPSALGNRKVRAIDLNHSNLISTDGLTRATLKTSIECGEIDDSELLPACHGVPRDDPDRFGELRLG